jgi:predicted aminopeptidase
MGVRRWLTAKGDRAALARYETSLANDQEIVALLLATREKLRQLYARKDLSPAQLRERKTAILAELHTGYLGIRSRHPGFSLYDRAFTKPWNNARLNTVSTYYDLVPGFERLMARDHGNLHAFYADVEQMRYLSKKERRARLMKK